MSQIYICHCLRPETVRGLVFRPFVVIEPRQLVVGRTAMASNRDRSSERGFASMDEDKQREIASKGGKAAHEKGTAHEFTSEEAREAGRKGGESVSRNREHMAETG